MRRNAAALLVGCALGALGCATEAPITQTTSHVLDPHRTHADLQRFLGTRRLSCVHSRPGYELCGWRLGDRDTAWPILARSLGTEYQLNVVCDLPTDDGPRERDSCHVFPRVALPFEVALRRAAPDVAAGSGVEATRAGEAARALERAITLLDLSLLVGSGPGECLRKSRTHQLCRWQSSNQTPGHALIAAVIDEDRRVVLACRIPYDNAPRDPHSCEVSLKR